MKKLIIVTPQKCLACKTCELACATEHSKTKKLDTAIKESPLPKKRIYVETILEKNLNIPLQCRHCEDAPCVNICPTKALQKQEYDIVQINQDRCIGCKWCLQVCPFGVIMLDEKNKVIIKCDLCIERLKQNQMPACVSSCPTGTLKIESITDLQKDKRKNFLVEYTNK